jgi:hypothetical protein
MLGGHGTDLTSSAEALKLFRAMMAHGIRSPFVSKIVMPCSKISEPNLGSGPGFAKYRTKPDRGITMTPVSFKHLKTSGTARDNTTQRIRQSQL